MEVKDAEDAGTMRGGPFGATEVLKFAWSSLVEQTRAVMPICVFLAGFQLLVLRQPLEDAFSLMGALGLAIVGLALFSFGLLYGLMPMGEKLGNKLPMKLSLPSLLFIAGILGVGVTLAEPALGVVKTAGSLIKQETAPYLFYLLHEGQEFLVLAVAVGVGFSASLGMLRIRKGWGLKKPAILLLGITLVLSCAVQYNSPRGDVIGLAWDLGAVTTGPVTVPLVIALGVGLAGGGHGGASSLTGFGVVTLASLVPVNTVLLLTLAVPEQQIGKPEAAPVEEVAAGGWTEQTPWMETIAGFRALLPLVSFMYMLLRYVLHETQDVRVPIDIGGTKVTLPAVQPLIAAQIGIIVFNIGLTQGLSRLGALVGATTPAAFTAVDGIDGSPLWSRGLGVGVTVAFAWVLGFGATLAEPALATLAITVDTLSKGTLSKKQVVYSVALGVGTGTALGVLKIVQQWPLLPMLIPGYLIAALLTIPSNEVLVNVAWDSAGVTTGPVTVPLVISLGLGLGKALGASDGFGILSLASVCPIVSVLAVGLAFQKKAPEEDGAEMANLIGVPKSPSVQKEGSEGADEDGEQWKA